MREHWNGLSALVQATVVAGFVAAVAWALFIGWLMLPG